MAYERHVRHVARLDDHLAGRVGQEMRERCPFDLPYDTEAEVAEKLRGQGKELDKFTFSDPGVRRFSAQRADRAE
jgi:hypothetical protein